MKRAIGLVLGLVLGAVWLTSGGPAPAAGVSSQDRSSVTALRSEEAGASSAQRVDKSGLRLAPEIDSGEWLNGAPVTLRELRGQVVVLDFWSFE